MDNFRSDDGRIFLYKCPSCKRENDLEKIETSKCVWCGWMEPGDPKNTSDWLKKKPDKWGL